MVEFKEPPPPPADTAVIGLVYDLGPDGATFEPPITLTIRYDPARIPEGIAQENLVIGMWDKKTGKWVELDSKVDPASRTISAKVSHFAAFTVLARTRPAAFIAGNLRISPEQVDIGQEITIKAVITNTGDLKGSHLVIFKVDGLTVASREVILAGQGSQEVSFTVTAKAAGTYRVTVDGLTGTFVVKEAVPPPPPVKPAAFIVSGLVISPEKVSVGETVRITVTVTNVGETRGSLTLVLKMDGTAVQSGEITLEAGGSSEPTFTIATLTPGTFTISIDRLSGQLMVSPALPTTPLASSTPPVLHSPEPVNWRLVVGALAAFIVLVTVLWRLLRRRRA